MEVGQLCMKIAGRDAGKVCVVVDVVDNALLIDGQVRRRKCNPRHVEPLNKKIDVKKGASHEDVVAALKKLGVEVPKKVAKKRPVREQPAKPPEKAEVPKTPKKKAAKQKAKKVKAAK